MAKQTISGFVYLYSPSYQDKPSLVLRERDNYAKVSPDYALIGPASFDYEVPDDFNPIPGKVAALEDVKRQVREEFAERLRDIDNQIQKLLAIEMSEPA